MIFFIFFSQAQRTKRKQLGNGFEAHLGSARGARSPVDLQSVQMPRAEKNERTYRPLQYRFFYTSLAS